MRPSRQQMFMRIAHVVAERSTCARLNVGAIITLDNRIVSMGWNGQASGAAHCTGPVCEGFHKPGSCGVVHAEQNALDRLHLGDGPGLLTMYVTDSPCMSCAGRIAETPGMVGVYFDRAYRDPEPIRYLSRNGIEVRQIMPAGYIISWPDKEVIWTP